MGDFGQKMRTDRKKNCKSWEPLGTNLFFTIGGCYSDSSFPNSSSIIFLFLVIELEEKKGRGIAYKACDSGERESRSSLTRPK